MLIPSNSLAPGQVALARYASDSYTLRNLGNRLEHFLREEPHCVAPRELRPIDNHFRMVVSLKRAANQLVPDPDELQGIGLTPRRVDVTHWSIKGKRDNKIAEIFGTESKDPAKTPGSNFSGASGRNDNSGILGCVGEAHKNSRFNAKWGILPHSVLQL